jgi:hypothetical protein
VQVDHDDLGHQPGGAHGGDEAVGVRRGDAGGVAPAVQAASVWSRIWLAARIATRCPPTVPSHGAYAASASAPNPTTGNLAAAIAASESATPTGP